MSNYIIKLRGYPFNLFFGPRQRFKSNAEVWGKGGGIRTLESVENFVA